MTGMSKKTVFSVTWAKLKVWSALRISVPQHGGQRYGSDQQSSSPPRTCRCGRICTNGRRVWRDSLELVQAKTCQIQHAPEDCAGQRIVIERLFSAVLVPVILTARVLNQWNRSMTVPRASWCQVHVASPHLTAEGKSRLRDT